MQRLPKRVHHQASGISGRLEKVTFMKKNRRRQWVPVRVFRAGTLQAVLWRPLDDARKTQVLGRCRVSLHRVGGCLIVKSQAPILIAPHGLFQAIEALREAQAFLCLESDGKCSASRMFVPAIDLLEAKAPW